MRHAKAFVIAIALGLGATVPAAAGPIEDGRADYNGADYAEAMKLWRVAALQGNTKAQLKLGDLYRSGAGIGDRQRFGRDFAEAAKWYRLAAEQGDASGQNNLAIMYANGEGVPQDYAEAVKWYRLAAEKGDISAMFNLGNMYSAGRGVPKDEAEAAKFYEPAYRFGANRGFSGPQYELGKMYYKGQGVPQDFVLAHMWFNLSAAQGDDKDEHAKKLRDEVAHNMPPAQIAEAQKLAREWKSAPAK